MQLLGRVQSFPRRCDFNQHALARNFFLLVKFDQLPRLFDGTLEVVGQPRVGLSGNATRYDLENIGAELDEEMIANVFDLRLTAQTRFLPVREHFVHQMPVLLLLSGGINQTRVRRRILRLEILDRFKVRRVGHDFGKLLQLVELIQLRLFLVRDSSAHNRSSVFLWGKLPASRSVLKTYAPIRRSTIENPLL